MYAATARAAAERLAIAAAAAAATSASSANAKRRELFGAAACEPIDYDDARVTWASDYDSDSDDAINYALRACDATGASSQRRVLRGVAAQLALLCAFMSAFEGHVGPVVLQTVLAGGASGELARVVRALPVFLALLALLSKTSSTYLWTLQLLVVAKIHSSSLLPDDAAAGDNRIARAALVAMLLAHALLRFCCPAPRTVAVALLTFGASALLASLDTVFLAGSGVVLLNCAFLGCTTLVMSALADDARPLPISTSLVAFAVAAFCASAARECLGVSQRAFAISLGVQLAMALLTSRELAGRRREDDEELALVADECAGGATFQRIELLVTFGTAACVLLGLLLLLSWLRPLVL